MPVIENFSYRPENMAAYYDRLADEREQERYCDRDREDCSEDCTTDTDCMAKLGGDGGPGR